MPTLIANHDPIPVPGGKLVEEYIGRVNSGDAGVIDRPYAQPGGMVRARASAPSSTSSPSCFSGVMHVEHEGGSIDVRAGQAVVAQKGEWVRYSTPGRRGIRCDLRAGIWDRYGSQR